MDMKLRAINIEDLDVKYHDYTRDNLLSRGKTSPFKALHGINCEVLQGENVALLGKNGAGKTTLLRCMAGLLRPSSGYIKTHGRVILLSGADPGFLPHLTGRQNVIELAAAYGIGNEEIEDFLSSIVEFCGLGDAIERNFKGYSTGMKGKLGFGFITSLEPEILLIDETLGVGDLEFRKKAAERLEGFIGRSGTVIISTHSLNLAKNMCTRGILLEEGKLTFDGKSEDAVALHIANSTN